MILVDTSIWVDHLRRGDRQMRGLLDAAEVLIHPLVIGELAMGDLDPRESILGTLSRFPSATVAENAEVLRFIAHQKLYGVGIGYIDAHLLASARLTPGATFWTRDKRLAKVAEALDLAFAPS